ncbi:hypothetical protein K435DRAFT_819431 [Dendrothele bispora CBS 962.96]|uniref:Integrase core domain-containing protein n=1 Tax=Dendrothele bispora (strain CBS 962.96) TaxID=1314807 RepID=A0A4S8M449_DENBC|nr:hypothetical protein K435DRAFT_819431 [Dendrothele bispora CBS 962.96]
MSRWGEVISVHNTRIERLWYDVTQGFGKKWYRFFLDFEHNHGLDPSNPSHIWLLHHLFLQCIQYDAQEWAEIWNNHHVTINGERERSPCDIFFFSQIQDVHEYGIDWQVINDSDLMAHLLHHNPDEWHYQQGNPMAAGPEAYSCVDVEPSNCPLTLEEVHFLDSELASHIDCSSRDMAIRCLVWDYALDICNSFFVP